jgi:hypothetical protein
MQIDTISASSGRSIRFTPERMQQIRNLVERGLSREQIAETIGTTLGSLQVTCSKYGISLRRPQSSLLRPPRSPDKSREVVMSEANGGSAQNVKLMLLMNDKSLTFELPMAILVRLVLQAEVRDVRLSDLIIEKLSG